MNAIFTPVEISAFSPPKHPAVLRSVCSLKNPKSRFDALYQVLKSLGVRVSRFQYALEVDDSRVRGWRQGEKAQARKQALLVDFLRSIGWPDQVPRQDPFDGAPVSLQAWADEIWEPRWLDQDWYPRLRAFAAVSCQRDESREERRLDEEAAKLRLLGQRAAQAAGEFLALLWKPEPVVYSSCDRFGRLTVEVSDEELDPPDWLLHLEEEVDAWLLICARQLRRAFGADEFRLFLQTVDGADWLLAGLEDPQAAVESLGRTARVAPRYPAAERAARQVAEDLACV